MKRLTIAIDFDGTWTADAALWQEFLRMAAARGHRLIIATGRTEPSADMARHGLPPGLPVVFCGPRPKRSVVESRGYAVDIWIDNEPGTIEPARLLATDGKDGAL